MKIERKKHSYAEGKAVGIAKKLDATTTAWRGICRELDMRRGWPSALSGYAEGISYTEDHVAELARSSLRWRRLAIST